MISEEESKRKFADGMQKAAKDFGDMLNKTVFDRLFYGNSEKLHRRVQQAERAHAIIKGELAFLVHAGKTSQHGYRRHWFYAAVVIRGGR